MPVVTKELGLDAPLERIWDVVSDPYALPRWWPRVTRVEEVSDRGWTMVLLSDRGKPIRADYTLAEARPMELLEWHQELEETPFERMLSVVADRDRARTRRGRRRARRSCCARPSGCAAWRGWGRRWCGAPRASGSAEALEQLGELVQ